VWSCNALEFAEEGEQRRCLDVPKGTTLIVNQNVRPDIPSAPDKELVAQSRGKDYSLVDETFIVVARFVYNSKSTTMARLHLLSVYVVLAAVVLLSWVVRPSAAAPKLVFAHYMASLPFLPQIVIVPNGTLGFQNSCGCLPPAMT
jgi:hypothetical protein